MAKNTESKKGKSVRTAKVAKAGKRHGTVHHIAHKKSFEDQFSGPASKAEVKAFTTGNLMLNKVLAAGGSTIFSLPAVDRCLASEEDGMFMNTETVPCWLNHSRKNDNLVVIPAAKQENTLVLVDRNHGIPVDIKETIATISEAAPAEEEFIRTPMLCVMSVTKVITSKTTGKLIKFVRFPMHVETVKK